MPNQDARQRINNFDEVAIGYDEEQALVEASRCLDCKKPLCVEGCPVDINIPLFIKFIKEKDYAKAVQTIKEKNNLPAICGRVCPQENQCEKRCVLGKKYQPVAIGGLERFVADWEMEHSADTRPVVLPPSGKKVAVIGSGPAGLTAAADLARLGHQVTIFEALHTAGGVLVYGIPEFRLPKTIVEKEINGIRQLGVEIKTNMVIGKIHTVDELLADGFDAVFVGTGAGLPYFMNIPGENLNGVYSANEFLTRINLMKAYLFPEYLTPIRLGKKVAVVGAGNVAMDSARTALRLGAQECYIVYRRSDQEMPARREEIEHAREEGVQFKLLTSPVEIIGDEKGWVRSMVCQRFELGEPDASGRRRPIAIPGSEYEIEIDTVIMAIGQGPNPLIGQTTADLELNRNGNIVADESTGQTSKPGVFAGGDIVTGAATVIQAMGAGKKAAQAIHKFLQGVE
ncbi:MAG: NADPH-dependent glutamate synthase [Syntrophomonadaceae bacterium]|jgi:glutamate synthase (NADPH/NADH) small chain|nr:NADPH-dependent glutamate synthase [Syntrophomonadaceae bacterium]